MENAEQVNKELFREMLTLLEEQWNNEELLSLSKKFNFGERASINAVEQIILKLIKHHKEFSP